MYLYLLLIFLTSFHLLSGQYTTSLKQQQNSFDGGDRVEQNSNQSGNKTEVVLIVLMSNQNELPVLFDLLKPSVEMAAEYVNSRYSEFRIRVKARADPSSCEGNVIGAMAAEEYYLRRLDAIIGPICSRALESAARLASHWGVPIITAGGVGSEFANKDTYKSLTRIAFSLDRVGDFFSKIMQDYDWHHIALIIDESEAANVLVRGTLERTFKALSDSYKTYVDIQEFSKKTAVVSGSSELPGTTKTDTGDGINYEKYLLNAKKSSRVFVLLTNGEISRNFMVKAHDLGMNNGEYAFIGIELIRNSGEANDFSWYKAGDKNNRKAKAMYESFLSLAVKVPTSAEYNLFAAKVAERATAAQQMGMGGKTAAINVGAQEENEILAKNGRQKLANGNTDWFAKVNPLVAAFYDAIVIYAWAHNKSLYLNENIPHNEKIRKLLWDNVFTDGLTGDLYINENGDRELDYTLSDFSPETGLMQPVLTYNGRKRQVEKNPNVIIHWPNGVAPADVPFCGYNGDAPHCQATELIPLWLAVILSLFIAGGIAGAIVWFVLQRLRSEADLNSTWWQIDYNEILFPTRGGGGVKSSLSQLTTSDDYAMTAKSGKTSSIRAHTQMSIATSLVSAAGQFDSVLVGRWRGITIAYKPLNIKRITMNRKMLIEFRQIRDTVHENLVRFLGLCLDDVNTAVVTELMIRGSLRDILDEGISRGEELSAASRDDFVEHSSHRRPTYVLTGKMDIDWTFRYSIISDIIEGMVYLHGSAIGYHGRLKSTNCVVDGRFMVKITDYGLRSLHKQVSKEASVNPRALFWTAPEHLRSPDPLNHGSKAGDVYAFAIILKEIITRSQPYEGTNKEKSLEPNEILDRVKMGVVPPFRPEIVAPDCPNSLIKVVNVCWQEEASKRPEFTKLKPVLRRISKGVSSSNFLDNLLKRMEQYSSNLERIVEEKTLLVVEEQAKTEEILYQIMPKFIALELKAGRPIPPELYESATVFVSDIVGFTVLSSMSSPLQVVNLLNDLYSIFDALINQFDAQKIETIGDAYMVASGVPIRNGNMHAKEIALLAIELLETVDKFKIRHLPKTKLRLRIGIHSGTCAAGVVGVKMPKWIVFGKCDTVNTAAFLEGTGEPLKIHVSESCKKILDTFNIFCLSKRGELETKENKKITTYWLDSVKIRAPM